MVPDLTYQCNQRAWRELWTRPRKDSSVTRPRSGLSRNTWDIANKAYWTCEALVTKHNEHVMQKKNEQVRLCWLNSGKKLYELLKKSIKSQWLHWWRWTYYFGGKPRRGGGGWLKGEGEADTGCNLNIRAFPWIRVHTNANLKDGKSFKEFTLTKSHLDHVPKL